ncbi:MAG: hypothetical protein EOM54_14970 [Clostridia bacterium]|nr:hypothetical protein [Clostridia bacterium]
MDAKKDELKRPVPASEWPDFFAPRELVDLTGGLIGRPMAYKLADEIGFVIGVNRRGIEKRAFFRWLLGDDNIFVQALRDKESAWTKFDG